MMKTLIIAIAVLALSSAAAAQQAPTGYVIKLSTQAGAVVNTTPLVASAVTCGVTPKAPNTGAVQNPTVVAWDDPAAPSTADCVYANAGVFSALPFGPTAYVVEVNAVNDAGISADSLPSNPFTHPGTVVPALTGVRVKP